MKITRFEWDGALPGIGALVRGVVEPADQARQVAFEVIADVRARGDAALLELAERFDGARPEPLIYDTEALADACSRADAGVVEALELAARNVRTVAEAQVNGQSVTAEPGEGQRVTIRQAAVRSAGVYAPGGRATYPSSVVMGVVPARVAGVERVVVATPAGPDGKVADEVLAAAAITGADRLYGVGGAQAIAALAFGTESVESVDVIAGPGGPVVQQAKLAVSGAVGIDGYAGPSELMVLYDAGADLTALALDLCAQAEHGSDGLLVACASEQDLLEKLADQASHVGSELGVAEAPLALIRVDETATGVALANEIAPEHLQIACENAESLAASVRYAGCVFTGAGGATAFGDYVAGSNHILPTGGAGRFRGPLGPATFLRSISHVHLDRASATGLVDQLEVLARFEGFPVHAISARARAEAEDE